MELYNIALAYVICMVLMFLLMLAADEDDGQKVLVYIVVWPVFVIKHTIQAIVWLSKTTVKYAKE